MKKTLRNNNEEIESFAVTYSPIKSGVFNIYLFGEIACASQFIGPIEALQAATGDDAVFVHLSTNGGSLSATDTFIQALRECPARIVVKATGDVHSAGSLILLAADEFSLSENFSCLIHNGGCGTMAKFSDYKAESQHVIRYMERVMRSSYAGFLDEEELEDVIRGRDLWMDAEEFVERHEKRNAYFQAQMEAQQDECHYGEGDCEDCSCGSTKDCTQEIKNLRQEVKTTISPTGGILMSVEDADLYLLPDEEPVEYTTHLPLNSPEPVLIPTKPSRKRKPQAA